MSFFKKLFGKKDPEKKPTRTPSNAQKPAEEGPRQQVPKEQAPPPPPPSPSPRANHEDVTIVPRIKVDYAHQMYASVDDQRFKGNPLPEGVVLQEDQMPITLPLFDDLLLCFAVDRGHSYELLQQNIFAKNPQLSEELLKQYAIAGLVKEIGEQIKIHGDFNHMIMITAGGNFEAAILLLDGLWEQLHEMASSDLILSVPARDLLFVARAGDAQILADMKAKVKKFFDNPATEGLLSKGIYQKEKNSKAFKLLEAAF